MALIVPTVALPPGIPFTAHVTLLFVVAFWTETLNFTCAPGATFTDDGLTTTMIAPFCPIVPGVPPPLDGFVKPSPLGSAPPPQFHSGIARSVMQSSATFRESLPFLRRRATARLAGWQQ